MIVPFGLPGSYGSVAVPGDYDGEGKTGVADYIPSLALFAYRPTAGGPDEVEPFGLPSTGQTVPAGANVGAFRPTTPADGGNLASAAAGTVSDLASEAMTLLHPRRKRHA